jgi:putative ABC transport system permease protein
MIKIPFINALRSLRANKMRTALTLLGIIIGISSVITMLSVGRGAQELILDQIRGIGSQLLMVTAGGASTELSPPAAVEGIVIKTLTLRDSEAIENNAQHIQVVAPTSNFTQVRIRRGNKEDIYTIQGRDREFFSSRGYDFSEGRNFTTTENDGTAKVAILGADIKQDLFSNFSAIGEFIRIGEGNYRIVGVLEKKESALVMGGIDDSTVMLPVRTAQTNVLGQDYLFGISLQASSEEEVDLAKAEVRRILRRQHRLQKNEEDDFTIRTQQDALAMIEVFTSLLTLFLSAIAAISLIVGGIGIMNIMLVSVFERTREIGLLKAVGAENKDIFYLFLIETLVIMTIGAIIALIIGFIVSYVASIFGGWSTVLAPESIPMSFIMAFGFGIVFGVYPAIKASKLDPITALRYE